LAIENDEARNQLSEGSRQKVEGRRRKVESRENNKRWEYGGVVHSP
jgi:hypothetical protein